MPNSDPPEVLELLKVIESLTPNAVPFNGIIVRSVVTEYANKSDFLSGEGAARFGGRWNRKGIKAIYGSTDILTATHEAYQQILKYGFSLSNLRPRVTAGAKVVLHRVLDLTSPANRRRIGYSLNELLTEDWQAIQMAGEESWTQVIGRGTLESGMEGLLVPSAQNPKGTNLVIFPKNIGGKTSLKILSKSALPPHPSSWPEN
jgi:RES domain-containing protein